MAALVNAPGQANGLMMHGGPTVLGERQVRIPVGGKIRAGVKVLTADAKSNPKAAPIYERMAAQGRPWDEIEVEIKKATGLEKSPLTPRNVPHFTVRRCDFTMPEVADRLIELYAEDRGEGRHLYRLPVILLTDSWQANLPHAFRCFTRSELVYWSEYGQDGARYCKTRATVEMDPKSRRARRVFGGRSVVLREDNGGICSPEKCSQYQARQCNLSGSLLFYVPGIPGSSAIELATTSFYSMQQMRQQMEMVSMIRGGRIAGTCDGQPIFHLAKVQQEVSMIDPETGKAKRVKQWLVNLEADIDMGREFATREAPMLAGAEAVAMLEHGRDCDPETGEVITADCAPIDEPQEQPPQELAQGDMAAMIKSARGRVMALLLQYDIAHEAFSAYGNTRWGDGWGKNLDALTAAEDELTEAAANPGVYKATNNLDTPF